MGSTEVFSRLSFATENVEFIWRSRVNLRDASLQRAEVGEPTPKYDTQVMDEQLGHGTKVSDRSDRESHSLVVSDGMFFFLQAMMRAGLRRKSCVPHNVFT